MKSGSGGGAGQGGTHAPARSHLGGGLYRGLWGALYETVMRPPINQPAYGPYTVKQAMSSEALLHDPLHRLAASFYPARGQSAFDAILFRLVTWLWPAREFGGYRRATNNPGTSPLPCLTSLSHAS